MKRTLLDLATDFDSLNREASSLEGVHSSPKLAADIDLTRALLGETLASLGQTDTFVFAEISENPPVDAVLVRRIEHLLDDIRLEIGALAA